MSVDRWLRAERVVPEEDVELLRELALDVLDVLAADPKAPRPWELARAASIAIGTYSGLRGDWDIAAIQRFLAGTDASTRMRGQTEMAGRRRDAKLAWEAALMADLRSVRAMRHLALPRERRKAGKLISLEAGRARRTGTE